MCFLSFNLDQRNWDFEEGQNTFRAGKIRENLEFWEHDLKAPPFVLSTIKHGYFLPFNEYPPPSEEKNNKSSLRNAKFVEDSIRQLLSSGCIEEVWKKPHCINPLTVAEGKKLRLVLDLRNVNKYLNVTKFKYENLRAVADILEENDFFVTFDLKNGYHHIPIAKDHQTYLGFAWEFTQGNQKVIRYFIFLVLAFGLATACYAFTKIMRPLIKKWRGEGKKSSMYLDDGILAAENFARTKTIAIEAQDDIARAGLTINKAKSMLTPSQHGIYLGFIIDTLKMEFLVPPEKIAFLKEQILDFTSHKFATPKDLSRIAGRLISMSPAIGPLTRLFTRQMYKFIEGRTSWFQQKLVPDSVRQELTFWTRNLDDENGHTMKSNPTISKIIYSDASDTGYGGYILQKLGNTVAQGRFRPRNKTPVPHIANSWPSCTCYKASIACWKTRQFNGTPTI